MVDSTQFERLIIKGLIRGYQTRQMMATLTVDWFEVVQMRTIFQAIRSYFERFNEVPQSDVLVNELSKMNVDKAELGNMEAFLSKKEDVTEDRFKYAFEEMEKAHLSRSLKTTMKEAITFIDKGEPRRAQDILLKNTLDLTSGGREIKVLDFATHFEERKKNLKERVEHPENFKQFYVPTGIEKFDAELDGGLRRGELGLMLAPPESGKSISLQDLSMSAVLGGFRVALFTIEMTAEQVAYRLDSRLSQIKYRKFRRAQMEDAEFERWESEVKKIPENKLKVIGVPEGCSCRLIESELSRMSGIFQPDLIAVDYCGIMSPNEGRFETSMDWKYVGAVVRNLKGLALKLNVPVWSASQLLVGAKEKAEVKFVDVGLARQQIAAHADVCVAIIQTNQMREMDITKLQLVKIREGCENRFIEIVSDYDRISLERKAVGLPKDEKEDGEDEVPF